MDPRISLLLSPLLPLLLPLPLTSASTDDEGKPHGTEVVGPGRWRKTQSGMEPFQTHQVCHEAQSLFHIQSEQLLSCPHICGQQSLTHPMLMATTRPACGNWHSLHTPTSMVSDHSPAFKSSDSGQSPSLTFKAYSHSLGLTSISMIPHQNSHGMSIVI